MCESKKTTDIDGSRERGEGTNPFISNSERKMPVRSISVEYLVGCRTAEFQTMFFRSSMIPSHWAILNRRLCLSHEAKKGTDSLKVYSGGFEIPGDGCASEKIRNTAYQGIQEPSEHSKFLDYACLLWCSTNDRSQEMPAIKEAVNPPKPPNHSPRITPQPDNHLRWTRFPGQISTSTAYPYSSLDESCPTWTSAISFLSLK
jgi:hypothetical protein